MRLLKLSLVFLGVAAFCAAPLVAQTASATPKPGSDLQIAPAPQDPSPFNYAQNGPARRFDPDRGINILPRLTTDKSGVCMKLRKYIFHRSDGGDAMQPVGETDCTYTSKVWPKSAEGKKLPRPQVGVYSTVLRAK